MRGKKRSERIISDIYIDFQFDELDPNSEKVKPIREGFMAMLTQMTGELNQSTDGAPPTPQEAKQCRILKPEHLIRLSGKN